MANTVSFFDAVQDGFVVGADSFLDMMVVWNGSGTFNVFYSWNGGQWQEIDCFTNYGIYSFADARKSATDYFNQIHEEAADEAEWMDRQMEGA